MLKKNTKTFISLQRIGLEVLRSCQGASLWYPGAGHLLILATSITRGMLYILLLQSTQGKHRQFLPISVSIFTSLIIFPVTLLLVPISCLTFSAVNGVNSHKKPKNYYLALDKFWVTQCGWLWLCTIIAMGIHITNGWKLFCCGIKRDQNDKLIRIR